MKRQVVAYIRVSTDEQAEHGQSLDVQEQVIADYANGHDLDIVCVFKEAESAFKPGRPKFQEMVQFLRKNKKVTGVLCYKVDRISRNMSDYALLVEEMGVEIISATEQLPCNPSGRLMGDMQAAFARFFSAQLSERVASAMVTKAKKGIYPSLAPTGYRNNRLEKTIEIDPEQGPIVRELFETYADSDMSLLQLVRWAKARGLRTRQGNPMQRSAIHNVLTNPFYYGAIRWREMLYEGRHKPLIAQSLYDRVQDKMHGRNRGKTERRFPFRGILICGHCGCKITATLAKGQYVYYHCTNGKGKCVQGYLRQDELAEICQSVVENVQVPEEIARMLLEEVSAGEEIRKRNLSDRILKLTQEREHVSAIRNKAYIDKLNGVIGEERWKELDAEWEDRLALLDEKIEQLNVALASEGAHELDDTLELLKRARDLYSQQDPFEQAEGLKILVSNLTLTDRNLEPDYRNPFDLVALGAKTGNWYP